MAFCAANYTCGRFSASFRKRLVNNFQSGETAFLFSMQLDACGRPKGSRTARGTNITVVFTYNEAFAEQLEKSTMQKKLRQQNNLLPEPK